MPDHVEVVFDDEERVAGCLELVERAQQRFGIGGMQARRRLVEDVDDAEQVGANLGGQPQSLQLPRRQRRRAAIEGQVAESEVEQHREAGFEVLRDALRDQRLFRMLLFELRPALGGGVGVRPEDRGELLQRQRRHLRDVAPCERDRERLATQPLAAAFRAVRADQIPRHALLHQRALRRGERMQHVASRAGEGAHVAGLFLLLQRALDLGRVVTRVHRNGGLLVRKQQPVTVLLRQLAPRAIDVVAERGDDVAQVLAVPRGGPCRDRALPNRQRIVGHHRLLGGIVDAAEAVTLRTRALRRVRRERFRVQDVLAVRVVAGARIQHPQQIRERRDAPDRRARRRRSALLLQRDRRREPIDFVDIRHAHLMEQTARVGRDRLEIAALCLRVEGAEGE